MESQFVGREPELLELHDWLDEALDGERTIGFVAGEAGSGKTTLIREFARQAQEKLPDLVFAFGDCDGQGRTGDPYLPFREIFSLLSGNSQPSAALSEQERENYRRVQTLLQSTGRIAAHYAPALIEMLVPGGKLITKTGSFLGDKLGWSKQLDRLLGRGGQQDSLGRLDQAQMYEQFTQYIAALSDQYPLLIVLDDMQWADNATLGLYFHLARRLSQKRVLLLGTYRGHDLGPQADGSRHELLKLQYELSRIFGRTVVDLDEVRAREGRRLVDQLLDREPNLLGEDFRQALYERTGGSALFTVELVSMLRDRGVLVRDTGERWVQSAEFEWSDVPPRIEGIIAERLNRLSAESLELLRAAGTEGQEFTAEVAACVAGRDARDAIRHLSETLGRQEQLVEALGVTSTRAGRASRYRFAHALFRQQLLATLDTAERCYLHEAVAGCLPKVYGDTVGLAQQLASHLLEARLDQLALPHLVAAGDSALDRFAYREAHDTLERAVEIIETGSSETVERGEMPRIYRRLGEARLLIGRLEAARDAAGRALELLDADDVAERVRLFCLEGDAWRRQNEERRALEAYEAASRLCAPDGTVSTDLSRQWIDAGIGRMWAHYFAGETVSLEETVAEVLPVAEGSGSQQQQATLMHGRLLARMRKRRFSLVGDEEAMRMAAHFAEKAEASGRLAVRNDAVFVLGLVRLFAEDWEESRRYLLESLQLADKIGDALANARALAYLTVLERRAGDGIEAISRARYLKATAEASGQVAYLSVAYAQIGWWAARNGDLDTAESNCHAAVTLWADRPVSYPLQWLAYWPLLRISLARRDADALRNQVDGLMREDQQPMPHGIAEHLRRIATRIEQGNKPEAFAYAEAALRAAEQAGYA